MLKPKVKNVYEHFFKLNKSHGFLEESLYSELNIFRRIKSFYGQKV